MGEAILLGFLGNFFITPSNPGCCRPAQEVSTTLDGQDAVPNLG